MAAQSMFRNVSSGVQQTAKQMAQSAAVQAQKTFETAKAQAGLPVTENLRPPETVENPPEVVQQIQENPQIDREALARSEAAKLQELEARLAQMRARRTQEMQSYRHVQESQMQPHVDPQAEKPLGLIGKAKKAIGGMRNKKQAESNQKNKG